MKKLVSLLLLLALCAFLLTATASAEAGVVYSEGFFYYTVADESITIVGYFGDETEITVPASIAGVPVNAIAPGAFEGTTVQVIHLPDTIMAVGEGGTGSANVHFAEDAQQPAESGGDSTQANGGSTAQSSASGTEQTATGSVIVSSDGQTAVEEVTVNDDEDEPQTTPDVTVKEGEGVVIATHDPNATPEPDPTLEATPEATEAPAEEPAAKSGGAIGWIIGAAVLVCGGLTVVLLRKKGGKA